MQAGAIEAGEPHVAHDHQFERIVRVAEALRQRLASRFVADVRLPVGRIGGRAGHHNLDLPLVVLLAGPLWPQLDDLAVELDADAPAHAHHHGLAL